MKYFLFTVIILLSLTVVFLAVKLYLVKRTAREIEHSFKEKLRKDTNTLIDVSCRDKDMISLADTLNKDLALIRELRHRYTQGDIELKNAIANISHDLRTPLTAICGYLELLKSEEKTPDINRCLEIIENRTEAMKKLIEELFQYSLVACPENALNFEDVSVNGVLEESIAAYYASFKEKGIEPQITITKQKIIRSLDKNALLRIFANILGNALKYSDGDLDITLTDSGKVIFANTASKLDEIQVGKIFDRFYTVENARSSTGLGLSIARSLAERMNAAITASYSNKKLSVIVDFGEENALEVHV